MSTSETMTPNLLSVYREASVEKTYHVHEPLGRLAEKWAELEWQALFQPTLGISPSLRERNTAVNDY
jgi:hypothetical protein